MQLTMPKFKIDVEDENDILLGTLFLENLPRVGEYLYLSSKGRCKVVSVIHDETDAIIVIK